MHITESEVLAEQNRLLAGCFEVGDFVATNSNFSRCGYVESLGTLGKREMILCRVWCGQVFCSPAQIVAALEDDYQVLLNSAVAAIERRREAAKVYRWLTMGRARHTVSFHDGEKSHSDGSPFFDLKIFSNAREAQKFVKSLQGEGYTECLAA